MTFDTMSSHSNEEKSESPADLNLFVEDLLEQMQSRFTDMGHSILGRMDDMGSRMDELEQSIASLLQQAGLDQNGFSNNSSIDTTTSFTSQTKTATQRLMNIQQQPMIINGPNKSQSPIGVKSAITSMQPPPISAVNDSPLAASLSPIVSTSQQSRTPTLARARVTIEI